jgi:hypothetical protein
MKAISLFFAVLVFAAVSFARTVDLYYTEDGRTVKMIRGFNINDNFTLAPEGDESWLLIAAQKIGPNGYTPKDAKLTLGTLGKTHSLFQVQNADFLGFGRSKRFERAVGFSDISYIIPDPKPFEPLHLMLNDGTDGQLFVAGEFTESTGSRIIQGKPVNDLSVIRLKYDIPRSQRGVDTRPQQFGLKAKAVAFTESGLRKAMRALEDLQ